MSSAPSSSSAGISLVASGGKAAFAVLLRTSSRTFWASEKFAAGTQISNSENSEEKTRRASRSSRLYGIFAASSAAVIAEKVPPLAPFQSTVGESISPAGVRSLWSTSASDGNASTRSASQSLQCVKPGRYSYLQTGQNIRDLCSCGAPIPGPGTERPQKQIARWMLVASVRPGGQARNYNKLQTGQNINSPTVLKEH